MIGREHLLDLDEVVQQTFRLVDIMAGRFQLADQGLLSGDAGFAVADPSFGLVQLLQIEAEPAFLLDQQGVQHLSFRRIELPLKLIGKSCEVMVPDELACCIHGEHSMASATAP